MRRRTGFLVGILYELVAVFGLFLPYVLLTSGGTEITLRTLPVDPRSVFRGDYVVLGYEAGSDVPYAQLAGEDDEISESAYIILERRGDVYERVGVSVTKPDLAEGQVCLHGVTQNFFGDNSRPVTMTFPDIAQYFVEEDLGRELESARNAHRLMVNVSVSPSCMAVIKGVILGPEVPQSEFPTIPGPVTPVL